MCGRAYSPDFLFLWPTAKISVMGGAQVISQKEPFFYWEILTVMYPLKILSFILADLELENLFELL